MTSTDVRKTQVLLLVIFASVFYGIIHDQITAHICVEYFSIAHPPLFHTADPVLLALGWGIAATIGIGAILGMLLAAASQSGSAPPMPVAAVARSVFALLAIMACGALLAGALGFQLSRSHLINLPASLAEDIAPVLRDRFMAVWFAHCASYLFGLVGGAFLVIRAWRSRGRPHLLNIFPSTPLAWLRLAIVLAIIAALYRLTHRSQPLP